MTIYKKTSSANVFRISPYHHNNKKGLFFMQHDNYKRVHKVCVLVTILIVLLLSIQAFFTSGTSQFFKIAIPGSAIIMITILNYFLPINDLVKGFLFGLIPGAVVIALFLFTHYALNKHYILIATVALVALYFKKEILIIYGIVLDVLLILAYVIKPENISGPGEVRLSDFVSILVILNGIIVLLYLLCKWGRNIIDDAYQNKVNAENILNELQNTFQDVENNTNTLDQSLSQLNSNISNLQESSQNITLSMQEMAKAIQEEASGAYHVNETMVSSKEIVSETLEISNGVIDKTNQMNQNLEEGWYKIEQMDQQMSILSASISAANSTVNGLQSSMQKINTLLGGIKRIADQTNLLALNASIESARAGEQGKGFAVVAGEIGKLAEQSANIVRDITALTTGLSEQSMETYEKVSQGMMATTDGLELINHISSYFRDLRKAYEATNIDISTVMNKIETVSRLFTEAGVQIQNIASISEENAAATQEVLATTENENKEIQDIYSSIHIIQKLSLKLKQLTNN